jgi:DNA-binding transcriptional regulator YdaS (Cro superfamily)
MDDVQPPIARACAAIGGQAEMARALGITPAAVNQWCLGRREVPAERCPDIERLTRTAAAAKFNQALIVTCEQIRPDVAWGVLREQTAPEAEPAKAA